MDERDKFVKFIKLIQTKLKAARIECLQEQADRIDLFDVLKVLRMIILKKKGNSILVNVSVGSKTIASMMACMMFNFWPVTFDFSSRFFETTDADKVILIVITQLVYYSCVYL